MWYNASFWKFIGYFSQSLLPAYCSCKSQTAVLFLVNLLLIILFLLKIFFSFILFDPSLSRCFFLPPYNWYHRQLCIFYHCFNKVMTFLGLYLSQLHHAQRSLTKELWGFTHLLCLAFWIKKQFIPSGKLF